MTLWSIGYGAWPAPVRAVRMLEALRSAGVNLLVDVRLNPCASNLEAASNYGPRPWTLQADPAAGIVGLLAGTGIDYEWMVELGNPQRQDPAMTILRAQLADRRGEWPVHRGLERLAARVRSPGAVVAVLCTCGDARGCHRTVVARALAEHHFGGALDIRDVPRG